MKQRNCWSGEAGSQWQMELGLGGNSGCGERPARKTQRLTRARWWFSRMRQVVDHARTREPRPPVQASLPGTEPRGAGQA